MAIGEEKKDHRRKLVLVLIPSLSFLGGAGYVGSTVKDLTKVVEVVGTTAEKSGSAAEKIAALLGNKGSVCKVEVQNKPTRLKD